MRTHVFFSALLAAPCALAAWENLTLSDFTLQQSGYSSIIADLDAALPNKKVSDIVANVNHKAPSSSPDVKNLVTGFTWEDASGYDDVHTEKWYPQGITTSADAYEKGDYDGEVINIVSWHSDHYDNGKRGARLSFVKMTGTREYRNVLLVNPTKDSAGKADFEAITALHAGGLFWYGTMLYVVDTKGGLRVFDLAHIYEVDGGDGIGRVGNGFQAYGYKYVIPQVRSYKWVSKSGVEPFRFSFVALDRTTTPDSIMVGEYNADTTPNRLVHFDIDSTSRLLKTDTNGIAMASKAVSHTLTKIQGGITINNKYFLTQSGGSLITFTWKDGQKAHSEVFPSVPEDMSYQPGKGLWTLMEDPKHRHVVAIDHTKY